MMASHTGALSIPALPGMPYVHEPFIFWVSLAVKVLVPVFQFRESVPEEVLRPGFRRSGGYFEDCGGVNGRQDHAGRPAGHPGRRGSR